MYGEIIFHDFHNGNQVTDENIDRWHKEVLQGLRDNDVDVCMSRSGNGFVIGIEYKEDKEIVILEVSNGYRYYRYKML